MFISLHIIPSDKHQGNKILTWPIPPEAPNTTVGGQPQIIQYPGHNELCTSFHHDGRGFYGGVVSAAI